MLRRKIDSFLLDWKQRDKKKSIFIEGPRQVGKTFAIKQFAKKYYKDKNTFYINFQENREYINIFSHDVRVTTLYQKISLYFPTKDMVPGKTLIVFDEIQECEKAILALRDFTNDGKYDVIASGAYAEVSHEVQHSFPVGYVERYHMDALGFEEFLWANGFTESDVGLLQLEFDEFDDRLLQKHDELTALFNEYMAIGGMPEVVSIYLKNRDYKEAFRILVRINDDYDTDILRYAGNTIKYKAKDVFQTIHRHLVKDYKKFQYKLVSEGGRKSKYVEAIEWLVASGILHKSTNLEKPERPLQNNERSDVFKLYMHDHGLLVAQLGLETMIDILKGNIHTHNNAVLECAIASILSGNSYELRYFEKNGKLDVDFVIPYKREIAAIEVKTADRPKSKVMKSLVENYNIDCGIRLSRKTIKQQNNIETYPMYLAMFIKR